MATAILSVAATILARRLFQRDAASLDARVGALESTVLGERRQYSVFLPPGYDADTAARYPVLYVLDGALQAGHTTETASLLARIGVIPATIVVGIPNDEETRARDYTPPAQWRELVDQSPSGGARRFLSFLQTELIPRIEADYRTARPRMLAGWSRGGHFVLYSQIAAPALFDARFAHSPFVWSDEDDVIVTRFEQSLSTLGSPTGFLYLSLGDQEVQTKLAFDRAVRVLESRAPSTLRWRADVSAGGDHNSNPRLSTPVGLCAVFSDRACRAESRVRTSWFDRHAPSTSTRTTPANQLAAKPT